MRAEPRIPRLEITKTVREPLESISAHLLLSPDLKRYSSDPKVDLKKLDAEYANAMRELSKHYPDDLDAATLLCREA